MKTTKFALLIFIFFFGFNLNAQKVYKFGHIDSNELLQSMPEREAANKKLQEYTSELETELEQMRKEFQTKYEEYSKLPETTSQLIRKTKETEIQTMNQKIQEFQASAQQELQAKETELLTPIIEKAKNAIKEVAKEQKFTYVFDKAIGALVYVSDDSIDILLDVKKKLGIQ